MTHVGQPCRPSHGAVPATMSACFGLLNTGFVNMLPAFADPNPVGISLSALRSSFARKIHYYTMEKTIVIIIMYSFFSYNSVLIIGAIRGHMQAPGTTCRADGSERYRKRGR